MFEDYLSRHDPGQLRMRAKQFLASRKPLTRAQAIKGIYNIVRPPGGDRFTLPTTSRPIQAGSVLYRARPLESISDMKVVADAWEPPIDRARIGRLNMPGEPMLYTAWDPATACFEVGVSGPTLLAMSHFVVYQDFKSTEIGVLEVPDNLSLKAQKKLAVILELLHDVFMKPYSDNDPDKYVATEVLVKDLYDLPPDMCQAWSYKSVADPSPHALNLCFRPDAGREVLRLARTDIVEVDPSPEGHIAGFNFTTLKVLEPDTESGALMEVIQPWARELSQQL
ncbi:RES domain-containing protein [Arthrobacter sp. cf158]|nr:RES domain-containing protein [Arthrobacter sp. cf158]